MTETSRIPVRYRSDIEQILEDEPATINRLSEIVTNVAENVEKKHGAAMRATHAKATGLLKGELIIADDLPAELAQGLFARPGRYDALVRFSQGPSEPLSDKAAGQRGMSIKVLGVAGAHVAESRETTTQDFVLAPDPAFINRNAETFLTNFGNVASKSTFVPESLIIAGSRAARGAEAVIETVGLKSGNLKFFGRPPLHPISHNYYSQAPIRFGDYIAKVAAVPSEKTLRAIGDASIDTGEDDNAFRNAMVTFFAANDAEFDIRVQLCTDLETMPIEDAAVEWNEEQSPYRTVARFVLPVQNAYTETRRRYFDERLAFNPWHALEAHRPLGSIMRARLQPYLAAQDYRQRANGAAPAEPQNYLEVPD